MFPCGTLNVWNCGLYLFLHVFVCSTSIIIINQDFVLSWMFSHSHEASCIMLLSSLIRSGTGALAIFLRRSFELDITTSDYDDQEIEENIAHNCRANGILPVLPHVKREFTLCTCLVITKVTTYNLN